MGTDIEQNLGGSGFSQDIEKKLFAILDRFVDSTKQRQERKSKPVAKHKAVTQPLSASETGRTNMQPVELQRQSQRMERIRLSKIYKAGRSLGCSNKFLGKLVDEDGSLEEAFAAIIDEATGKYPHGHSPKSVPSRQAHAATRSYATTLSLAPGSIDAAEFAAKQDWSRSGALQAEFPNFKHYAAFKRHESHIKILRGGVVRGGRVGR